ncbi:MAG: thymidylate synthase [Phenylobacterium sp.]
MSYILEPYDNALEEILKHGKKKADRTGIGTLSIFGMQRRYRINEYFPILTKRKIFPKSIFAELIWLLSGSANNKDLQALGSNIWTPWVNSEFEAARGYPEGDLGPIYGFQMRHFNGDYKTKTGGFDQLQYLINEIKNNPSSRRMLVSYWNPSQIFDAVLPPCHYSFQVYIDGDGYMSGMLTQRSADFPIGVPANIQFYSAFIYMLAQQTGYKPYEFIHTTADSHIYINQVEAVEEYLGRIEIESPELSLNKADDIFSYKVEDFVIKNYSPLPKIKIPVAI